LKKTLLKFMAGSGFFAPFRFANRHKALILTYHRFSENEKTYFTSRQLFREQIRYLKKHYNIVSLTSLANQLKTGSQLPQGCVAITIDDGYADSYEIAFPVLKEQGVPATIFVVTDFLDKKSWIWTDKMRFVMSRPREEELRVKIKDEVLELKLNGENSRYTSATRINNRLKKMSDDEKEKNIERIARELNLEIPATPPDEFAPLNWEQAREMDKNNFSVESHTVSHPILTNVTDERLKYELKESRDYLSDKLGREVKIFCYPNGNFNERVLQTVERTGYESAVTTVQGFNENGVNRFALKRLDAEFDMIHFAQSTSGFELWRNKLRARVN